MKIPGIKFHHINLDEDQPYMGAGVKRQMRQAAQFGASKFTTNDEFKRINQSYFDELLKKRLNDPKKLAAKVKKAANFCQQVIDGALGGVKVTGKIKKIIDGYQSNRTSSTQEADAYALASAVGDDLSELYRYYGYYLGALEQEKQDKITYGTADFSRSDAEGYAKDVQRYSIQIMSGKFR
jgi:2-oxoglutarate dehydrogenase complex dehydrogenase (E1) component-like enzyme